MSTTSSIASIMGNENSNRIINRNPGEERPKQRRRLLIKEKAGILQWMDANKKTLEETCQEFDLSISTLAKWRMRRNEIIHQANSAQGNLKSHHAPKFPQVEAKVLAWIVMQQQEDEANAAVAASTDDTLTTTSTPTAPITNKTIEQYFHQAKREVLAQMGGSEHDHDGLTEEELRKKRKLERLSVSPEFVRNFMFRHGFPTSEQEDIFAFASEMTSPMMNTNMQNIPMINTAAPIHQQQPQQPQLVSPSTLSSPLNAASAWDARISSIEQQWGVSSNQNVNRKDRIEAVERQVFGAAQIGTLEQRIQSLE